MSENNNMELNDELMNSVTGGSESEPIPVFQVGDKVWFAKESLRDKFGLGEIYKVVNEGVFASDIQYYVHWEKIPMQDVNYFRYKQLIKA